MQLLFASHIQVVRLQLAYRFRPWSPKHITDGGRISVRTHFPEECINVLNSKLESALIHERGWHRAQFHQIESLNELLGDGWHTRTMPRTETVLTAKVDGDSPITVGWHRCRGSRIGELVVSFAMSATVSARDRELLMQQVTDAQADLAILEAAEAARQREEAAEAAEEAAEAAIVVID